MYNLSPLLLNAAETGHFDGDWRVATNYRQQWKAIGRPFQTMAASFDSKIYALPGNFSVGGLLVFDQSGALDLVHNRAYLSIAYAYNTPLWDLSAGIQAGYVLKSHNLSRATFPEQYNPNIGLFDPNLPLSETGLGNQTGYLDMNIGLLASRQFDGSVATFGFSILHLNAPDISFFNNRDQLPARYTVHMRWRKDFAEGWFMQPMALFSTHAKAQSLMLGGQLGLKFDQPNGLNEAFLGVDMRTGIERNGDAFIASGGIRYGNFTMAMAYDVNYSSLNVATNNRGAVEISLIYTSPSTEIKRITIPCDRF